MLNIDYSIWPVGVLWIQIANFLVLLFVLNLIAYRPIRRIMSQRREEMDALEKTRSRSRRSMCRTRRPFRTISSPPGGRASP